MRISRSLLATLLLVPMILVGGCRERNHAGVDVAAIGAPDSLFDKGARLSAGAQLVRAATAQGLVALDEQGQVIPALADRWIVTDDGASYIFRLRDGTWADGTPLAGDNVAAALRQVLAGLAGTPMALDLADVDEVRAMAGRVVEIRLKRAVPDLLQLLAQPELGLTSGGKGSGPLQLTREGALARLAAIPAGRSGQDPADAPDAGYRPLRLRALPAVAATRSFAEGKVQMVTGGRFADLPLAQAVAGLSQRALRLDPAQGLFGLAVVSPEGPLAAPEVREALSMAIDREALGEALGLAGWVTATQTIPPEEAPGTGLGGPRSAVLPSTVLKDMAVAANRAAGRAGGAAWNSLALADRRARAAARIARWKTSFGQLPPVRLALPAGPGADVLFGRIVEDFGAIGVPVVRVVEGAAADLRVLDLVARYARAGWYLNQLSCAARRTICNPAADASLAAARDESDPARRAADIAEAQGLIESATVFIPLGSPVRWSLVADEVSGFAPNAAAFHPLPPLARKLD